MLVSLGNSDLYSVMKQLLATEETQLIIARLRLFL